MTPCVRTVQILHWPPVSHVLKSVSHHAIQSHEDPLLNLPYRDSEPLVHGRNIRGFVQDTNPSVKPQSTLLLLPGEYKYSLLGSLI